MAAISTKRVSEEPAADTSRGKQQKKQKQERQLAQPTGELKLTARKLWEQLRRGDLDSDIRSAKMSEMMTLISGRIKEITFKHDMSRVIQTCLKYGNDQQRATIAAELMGSYLDLSKSQYGRYILMRMLKYCPKYRTEIIKSFYGHVRKLVKHKDASVVLEECYAVYANAAQRWQLVAEFYGNEFAIFKTQDNACHSLEDILQKSPQKKDTILHTLKGTLTPLLEKGTVQHSIVHRALLDYLKHAETKDRLELIETMRELVVEILHTRDGAHAGMLCLLYGTPKDRKAIVKSFKPYLQRISCEEYGYAVLIEALDCVDDTVYLGKQILNELGGMAEELLADQYGRRVLLYVLAGRHPHYVGIDALEVMAKGDVVRSETSKKDPMQRHRELAKYISPQMVKWVTANVSKSIYEPMPSQSVSEILIRALGDKSDAWNSVLELITKDDELKLLTNPTSSRVITNCIMAEYGPPKSKDVSVPELPDTNPVFGTDVLAKLVEMDLLKDAACVGAFPVRALLESSVTGEKAQTLLKPHKAAIQKSMKAAKSRLKVYEAIISKL